MKDGDRVKTLQPFGYWSDVQPDGGHPVPLTAPAGTIGILHEAESSPGQWFLTFTDGDGVERRMPRVWPEQLEPAGE